VEKDTVLEFFANGSVNYQLFGTNIKLTARWDFKAPEGSGDSQNSVLHGTKANLYVRQGASEKFTPVLYIEPVKENAAYEKALFEKLESYTG